MDEILKILQQNGYDAKSEDGKLVISCHQTANDEAYDKMRMILKQYGYNGNFIVQYEQKFDKRKTRD